MAFTPGI
jgi:hypothetical protein